MSSAFARLVQQSSYALSRRSYSVFSSKPGGGRYFNSTKPPKVTPIKVDSDAKSKSLSATPVEDTKSPSLPTEDQSPSTSKLAVSSQPTPHLQQDVPQPPSLPPHRSLDSQSLQLHHFFSLHRPLLLLSQPTSSLFDSLNSPLANAPPFGSHGEQVSLEDLESMADMPPDADAEAARQLARAMVVHRVGSWLDWESVLSGLGDSASTQNRQAIDDEVVRGNILMDSTKRKRRKKMTKHKLKKRRKLQRSERRRLGK